ncbi:MAG: hypothetical protein JRN20_21590 [Nitrososphaerota archaeon]|nr:hypothetical protein [Nitrososphaerota archaeon]
MSFLSRNNPLQGFQVMNVFIPSANTRLTSGFTIGVKIFAVGKESEKFVAENLILANESHS